jgi:hypothetical protein
MKLDLSSRQIAEYAEENVRCPGCDAEPGAACTGERESYRLVCLSRFREGVITLSSSKRNKSAKTLESLPYVPPEEIESRKTPKGGYSFTRDWALSHGIPWPLPAGWKEAVSRVK